MLDAFVLYTLLLFVGVLSLALKWKKPARPYPPGPKGYPILGNVLDLPMGIPVWESFVSLAKNYGALRRRFFS